MHFNIDTQALVIARLKLFGFITDIGLGVALFLSPVCRCHPSLQGLEIRTLSQVAHQHVNLKKKLHGLPCSSLGTSLVKGHVSGS